MQDETRPIRDLLQRYLLGEHEQVWQQLRSHESVSGDLLEEATAIAIETMKRVAHNADLLSSRLEAQGWDTTLLCPLRTKPSSEDVQIINQIENITGAPLPLSLLAFWQLVGGVNYVWDYDSEEDCPDLGVDLALDELDPLCIEPPQFITYHFEEWHAQESIIDPDVTDPFLLSLAPDYLHKANISGGAAYAIQLPFLGVDPPFANEAHNLSFTDYLRLSFKWAGFPMIEKYSHRTDVQDFVATMTKDFEPF